MSMTQPFHFEAFAQEKGKYRFMEVLVLNHQKWKQSGHVSVRSVSSRGTRKQLEGTQVNTCRK